ncbi:PhzF family phenazine biosynthesis protein [Microbacterium sp. BWT-B31]|uniref:PhzF family phenazine biosynthesis protein n=1 Tax=Microbacterium sp. BWT-B31 TaxID=3232072 RepID=UPI0035283BDB
MSLTVNEVRVFVDREGAHGNPLAIAWADAATRGREQQIAGDLGFSETIFIDAIADGVVRARIFTPAVELPFAGHPTVGLAAWLRESGDEVRQIVVPAGSVRVRADGDVVFVTAMPDWAPEFEIERFDAPADVDAIDPETYADGMHYVWAWIDEGAHTVRARMFAPDLGIREDEATGSAAIRLTAALGVDLDIRQGRGSRLHTHVRYLGQQIEVGGRTSAARVIELG